MKRIAIIGAGLAGSLLSLFLARRGYQVAVFEARADLRLVGTDKGRSINLALSCRGITGLGALGLMDDINKFIVPMRARAIHEQEGDVKYQPFGRHPDEFINAIQRTDLNIYLLDKAKLAPNIIHYFNVKLIELNIHQKTLSYLMEGDVIHHYQYDVVIGADGANSLVRETLVNEGVIQASREFLPHGYKELSISREHGQGLAREHLHLWPRGAFLLLGNPNMDDSITGSLFLANEGPSSFSELTNEIHIEAFFKKAFPDAYRVMPDLIEEFISHPTGRLSTVKCTRWYYQDSCLLIGDAAHGLVPFFGQGMNSAFEDCRLLDEMLTRFDEDWQQVLPAFFELRKPSTDAVAQLSMENYHEIQVDIRNSEFILRKQLELALMHRYPDTYISKHVLVMFTNTPYEKALAIGQVQKELLDRVCQGISTLSAVNWSIVDSLMKTYAKKLTIF